LTHDAYSTKRVTVWPQERNGEPGYAIKYRDGYISWCPCTTFYRDYQPLDALSFGHALHALEQGHRVARAGWNGKGMYIFLEKGSFDGPARGWQVGEIINLDHPSTQDGLGVGLFEAGSEGSPVRLPHICMRSASGAIVVGWLASQTDMLAKDWTIVS